MWGPTLIFAALALPGCAQPGTSSPGEAESATATGGSDTTASGSGGDASARVGERCANAAKIAAGHVQGSLRGRTEDFAGACGAGGPEVFYSLYVPWKSDVRLRARGREFDPRLGVIASGCSEGWANALGCGQGVDLWISDLAPGTELAIAVGGAPSELFEPSSDTGSSTDPLAFELDVRFRRILEVGERCSPPDRGRCPTGTRCRTDEADPRCEPVAGDVCADAIPVEFAELPAELRVPADAVHSDAHHHGCGGARRPERVFRVHGEPFAGTLRIEPLVPDILVGVRVGSCLTRDEFACVRGHAAEVEISPTMQPIYLFLELPVPGEPSQPADSPLVRVSLQD